MADVEVEVVHGVAHLRLSRPRHLNALTLAMGRSLHDALDYIEAEPQVRALILTGAGSGFCSGADLEEMQRHEQDRSAYVLELSTLVHGALCRLRKLAVPVIGAVNGVAAGGGFSLTLSCDAVVAATSSRFVAGYHRIGLTPDAGATYWLPRLVGPRRAWELLFCGRVLSAREACEWGLVNVVVEDVGVLAQAQTWAEQIARGPRHAQAHTRRLLEESWRQGGLEDQLNREQDTVTAQVATAEAQAGIAAFAHRRVPEFPD